MKSNHIIRGLYQVEYSKLPAHLYIRDGGFDKTHITLELRSLDGEPITNDIVFYGEEFSENKKE